MLNADRGVPDWLGFRNPRSLEADPLAMLIVCQAAKISMCDVPLCTKSRDLVAISRAWVIASA